jgi:hypothetical protein
MRLSRDSRTVIVPARLRVVEDTDVLDDEVTAFDRDDGLFVRLHFALGPGQGEVANLRLRGVLDLKVALIGIRLDEPPRPEKTGPFPADSNLFREGVVARRDKKHAVRIRVERRLDRIVIGHRQTRFGTRGEGEGEREEKR